MNELNELEQKKLRWLLAQKRKILDTRRHLGCWIYPTLQVHRGYVSAKVTARYTFDGIDVALCRGSRLSYFLFHGDIPEDAHVDHICFNGTCVNPAHLQLLTPGENARRRKDNSYRPVGLQPRVERDEFTIARDPASISFKDIEIECLELRLAG